MSLSTTGYKEQRMCEYFNEHFCRCLYLQSRKTLLFTHTVDCLNTSIDLSVVAERHYIGKRAVSRFYLRADFEI